MITQTVVLVIVIIVVLIVVTNEFKFFFGKQETKCEVCGAGLGRTEVYGRNLCEHCEDQLHG